MDDEAAEDAETATLGTSTGPSGESDSTIDATLGKVPTNSLINWARFGGPSAVSLDKERVHHFSGALVTGGSSSFPAVTRISGTPESE